MNVAAVPDGNALSAAPPPRVAAVVPWYCVVAVLGAMCIPLGVLWDISWHMSVGRDTFWTPAHIMIHMGGLVPAAVCVLLVLRSNFGKGATEGNGSVSLFGFRAPLGAWVVLWGCGMMLFSAPFDDWWHDAYGLDVEILSPPHSVLAAGMLGVATGVLLLMVSVQNRHGQAPAGRWLFIVTAGVLLTMASIYLVELSYPNQQRSGGFYRAACIVYPLFLAAAVRGSTMRLPATTAALVYSLLWAACEWVLPLFRASPLLGPIYNPVDHYVRLPFPILLPVPALVVDLLIRRWGSRPGAWRDLGLAAAVGPAFLLVLHAVQWNFSAFLIGPGGDNWFFGGGAGRLCPYFENPGKHWYEFWSRGESPFVPFPYAAASSAGWVNFLVATGIAIFSTRVGLALGNWMSRVRR